LDVDIPPTSIGVSEGLDRSFNFSEVFQLVKKSVKSSLGKRRTGLMLGLADLPEYIGAFHQMGSNFIVMNRSLLDQVTHIAKDRQTLNAYVFYTLLHEYLHTLGYVDEGEVRRLTRQICARVLGPEARNRRASGHVSRTHISTPWRASVSETSQVRDRPRVRERIQELRGLAAALLARFSANEV
jgi:hypothetical protein